MDKVCLSNDNFNKLLDLSLKNCYSNKKNEIVSISQPQNSIKFKPHNFVQINTPNCPPKYYNYNGDCKPCPYGSYSSPDQTYCIPGIKNTNPTIFDPASGTFKNCPKNSYKESSLSNNCICNGSPISLNETCVSVDQKNVGKFLDSSGQLKDCPDGTLSSPNNTYCISKNGGQTFDVKSGVFQPCPDGTYKLSSDISNTCQKCPDGTLSSPDKTYCISKSGGQIFNTQTGYMVDCPSFSYKFSSDTSNTCQDCPNHTNSSDDRTYCISNKPGQFFDIDGQFKDCPNGTYKGPLNKCESCPKGSNSSSDRTYCTLAYPNNGGKIFDAQTGKFLNCPEDTYKEASKTYCYDTASSQFKDCPSETDKVSKTNISNNCKYCPTDIIGGNKTFSHDSYPSPDKTYCILKYPPNDGKFFEEESGTFQSCPNGTYKDYLDTTTNKCKKCPIDIVSDKIKKCTDGSIPVSTGVKKCKNGSTPTVQKKCRNGDILVGEYNNWCPDGSIPTEYYECPDGSTPIDEKKCPGTSNINNYCISLRGGEIFDVKSGKYKPCEVGTYKRPFTQSNICEPCPTADITGLSFCCPPGSKLSTDKKYCIKDNPIGGEIFDIVLNRFIKCQKGTISKDNKCIPCPDGYYTSEDQTSCLKITDKTEVAKIVGGTVGGVLMVAGLLAAALAAPEVAVGTAVVEGPAVTGAEIAEAVEFAAKTGSSFGELLASLL